ncbi:MAG: MFS transporter [Desulfobacteraceae bacterium]|jgi:MFS family permease
MDRIETLTKAPLYTREFFLLLASGLLLTTGIGIFYLFPLYVLDLGGSKSDIGILMGTMSLSAVALRPWTSGLVDRLGRKGSMAAGCMLMTAVSIAHLFFSGAIGQLYPALMLLRLLFGTGVALGIIASLTLAADLAPASRLNEGLGIFGVMPLMGIAIGPVVGEGIINQWGFNAMFLAAAVFFTAGFCFLLPLKDNFTASHGGARSSFMKVLQNGLVWRMAFICLCFGVAFAAHGGFVAPFAKAGAMPVSAYFVSYSTAAVISRLLGGKLADRFGEKRLIPVALVIAGMGFVGLIQVTSTVGLAGTGFVAGLGHGLLFPSLIALTIRPIAAGDRGKVTGILTGGVDAGMFLGSLTMGQLGEFFGFPAIFTMAAATIFVGLGTFLWTRRMAG